MKKTKLNFGEKDMSKLYNKFLFNIRIKDMNSINFKDLLVVFKGQQVVNNVLLLVIKDLLVETDKGNFKLLVINLTNIIKKNTHYFYNLKTSCLNNIKCMFKWLFSYYIKLANFAYNIFFSLKSFKYSLKINNKT
jgi:hypothetical protein